MPPVEFGVGEREMRSTPTVGERDAVGINSSTQDDGTAAGADLL
jgi:hypothetical protein